MAVTVGTNGTNYILKTLWPQSRVENLVYPDHPLLAMMPKDEKFYGENMYLAVRGVDTQGRSAAFSTAAAAAGSHNGKRFLLTRVSDYQVCVLSTEAILASKSDKGALIKHLDTEIESGMNNIGKSLAVSLYRGKSGVIGRVGSVSGGVITLSNVNDVTSFEVGMVLNANPTLTGTSGDMRSGDGTISAVDRDAGTVTYTGTISSIAANDYLYPKGDYDAKISGLADWLPTTAPTSALFFGVDRSSDPTRYAGLRLDVSSLNPEEACVTALSRLGREGAGPKHLFVNHLDYRNIGISLGSKVEYESLEVGDIGFQAIKLHGPKGAVSVIADQDCPAGTGYALDLSKWKLYSLEKCPQVLDLDGNRLLRVSDADNWQARIAYFAQLGTTAPGHNGVLTMPT